MLISPDGKHVYTTSYNALDAQVEREWSALSRDATSGVLTRRTAAGRGR